MTTMQPADDVSLRKAPAARPLDVLNFALIDVNGAVKPYLNVFLYVRRDRDDAAVGLVGTLSGLLGIAVQAPAGAAVDAAADKRLPLLVALVILSFGATMFGLSQHFWPVLVGSCLVAAVAGVQSPIVAAVTMAVTRRPNLTRRFGRNAACERAGNVAIAIGIGAIGWLLPDEAVFLLVPALCIVSAAALYSIPQGAPDSVRRPAPAGAAPDAASSLAVLRGSRPLLVFALCAGLFHFANGPLLTLVSQDIAKGHPRWSATIVSVCIVGAQAVMVPMALIVGRRADRWGRKPLLVAAFVALPIRAILYTVWHNPVWLVAVQLIDGVGAGLLSAAKPLVVADVMEGTGRYNLALGIVGTLQAIGGTLSFVVAGFLVQHAGFDAAYLACGAVAAVALWLLVSRMPETRTRTEV